MLFAEIDTLAELVREVSNHRTGGYDVEFDIQPNLEKARTDDGFFLIIKVTSTDPNPDITINGEWWFWDDNTVMQAL